MKAKFKEYERVYIPRIDTYGLIIDLSYVKGEPCYIVEDDNKNTNPPKVKEIDVYFAEPYNLYTCNEADLEKAPQIDYSKLNT